MCEFSALAMPDQPARGKLNLLGYAAGWQDVQMLEEGRRQAPGHRRGDRYSNRTRQGHHRENGGLEVFPAQV